MPIVTSQTVATNLGQMSRRVLNRGVTYQYFLQEQPDVITNDQIEIEFLSKNNNVLFVVSGGVKETILNSVEFNHDFRGSADCIVRLVTAPPFPIVYGAKIRVKIAGKIYYTGYLFRPQSEFNSKKGLFEFKFFGLRKRYEKQEVILPIYNITSITKSGTYATYNFSPSLPAGITANQRIAVRRTDNENNRGYYLIKNFSSNSITVDNFFGVAQATSGGDFVVLPPEWSNSIQISEVFRALAKIGQQTFGIEYNPAKIEFSSGKMSGGYYDFNGMDFDKAMESIEKSCSGFANLGVDQDGEWFFQLVPEQIRTVLNTGYELNDPALTLNYNTLANVITGERTKGRGDSGNGFDVAAVAGPSGDVNLSIAKYGKYTKRVQLPGFLSDGAIQTIIDRDLQNNKEPRYSAHPKQLRFDRFWDLGDYDICPLPDIYLTVISECDSLDNFTSAPATTISTNQNVVITGAGSLQINTDYTQTNWVKLTQDVDLVGKETIEFWINTNTAGDYLSIDLTDGVITENYPVFLSTQNQFVRIVIDLSASALLQLTEITFAFGVTTADILLYVDEISIRKYGAEHIRLPLKKASYKLKPHSAEVDLEFGSESEKLSEYLQALQMQIEKNAQAAKNKG